MLPVPRTTGAVSGRDMLAAAALASLVTGLAMGWLIRATLVMAQISRSQERMQRKVRYWQSEAAYARNAAERLARYLVATPAMTDDEQDLPPASGGHQAGG